PRVQLRAEFLAELPDHGLRGCFTTPPIHPGDFLRFAAGEHEAVGAGLADRQHAASIVGDDDRRDEDRCDAFAVLAAAVPETVPAGVAALPKTIDVAHRPIV